MAFLFCKALMGLVFYDALMWCRDFSTMFECVRTWKVTACAPPAQPEIVNRVCMAVNSACVWYPKRVLCLQRSAVGACLLRHCGIPAKMVIGVRIMPILAHAWVEVDGAVVNDVPRVQQYYRYLASH
jgi:hypothetical protein